MADKLLVSFIRENLGKGYSIFAIRQHLVDAGYSDRDITSALNEVYTPIHRHEIHFSKAAIAVVVVLAVLLSSTAFFIFWQPQNPEELLDISMTARSEKAQIRTAHV